MIRNDEIRVCGCKLHGPCNMESIITLNIQLRCIKFMINPDSMITWAPGNTWGLFSCEIIGAPTHDS